MKLLTPSKKTPVVFTMVETTKWDNPAIRNHVYIFNEKPGARTGIAVGYLPSGTQDLKFFSVPMTLDLRGRTLEKV